jgi:hypothetical protein
MKEPIIIVSQSPPALENPIPVNETPPTDEPMKSDEEHIPLDFETGADTDEGAMETSSYVGNPEKAPRGRKPKRKKREEKSYRDVTAGVQHTIPEMIETRSSKKGKASKGATPPLWFLMLYVSWNCRGLGSKLKEEVVKDLVRMTSPDVLLIQETKMEEPETFQASKNFWKKGASRATSARGALGALATFWNSSMLDLIEEHSTIHWLFTKLLHRKSGHQVSLFNIYAPVLLSEKKKIVGNL